MHSPKHRPPLFLIALVVLAGCQLTEIYDLDPKKCENFTAIWDNAGHICDRDTIIDCAKNSKNALDQSNTEGAFKYNRCPLGYACIKGEDGNICKIKSPLCQEDGTRCEDRVFVKCTNYQLDVVSNCPYGCISNGTNAYCRECQDNEEMCENRFIISCSKGGENMGKWDDTNKQICQNGCNNGERGNNVSCYECVDTDEPKCYRDDGAKVTTIKKCLAHKWEDTEVCELGCVEGTEAKCKLCNHGDKKYYNNEEGYCVEQECKDNQYQDVKIAEVSCNSDLSGIGECLNGSPKCDKGVLEICIDGKWKKFGRCNPEQECDLLKIEGREESLDCYDSIVGIRCENNQLLACQNNAPCKSSGIDNLICASCQNGTSICENNKIKKCQDGEYEADGTQCPTDTHCVVNNGNAQCLICENDQQRCSEDGFIQNCINYKWETTSGCPDGYSCYQFGDIAGCGCSSMSDICESYEICQDGVCQRMSCTEDVSICKRCQDGKCYDPNNNLLLCDNSIIKDFWWKNYGIIDSIIHIDDNDSCNVYESLKQVINEEGTNLCNKIKTCGNPNALEECMFQIVLNVMAGNMPNDLSDKYGGSLDIADAVRVNIFVNDDHSECNISKCETDDDCTKYQQCNTKGECVRKPCSRYPEDINICGDGYMCVKDVCEEKCDIDSTRCQGNTLNTCAKGYWETKKCSPSKCKEENGKAECVEEDN